MQNNIKNIKNLVLCRTEIQSELDSKHFNEAGFNVYLLPTIKIIPIEIDCLTKLKDLYNYVIFTSVNSVKFYFKFINKNKIDIKFDAIICVGNKTKKTCIENGLDNIFVPDNNSSEGIIEYFRMLDTKGKNILIPGSKISNTKLVDELKVLGSLVTFLPIYDNIIPDHLDIKENIEAIKNVKIDMFVFTSPSTFNNFLEIMQINKAKDYFENIKIACIGSITKKSIEEKGLSVDVVPETFDMENLITAVKNYYKN